jgi:hypothetical protein
MAEDDDRIAGYAEQLEQLGDLPSPQREEEIKALLGGIPAEDREAFHAFAVQKRAHYGEMVEHHAKLLRAMEDEKAE